MTFLPVVERELRVISRRAGTYWMRFGAALVAIGLASWVWAVARYQTGALSLALFYTLSGFALVYCLLSGLFLTSDCLSEEKREGTLGLLFLTDLKGYDVVFGKLAATSVASFYSLFSLFPVMAIPLLLGGLTAGDFWRMALVLVNSLFFSLSAGVFVSALSKFPRKAAAGTLFVILAMNLVPPVLGGLWVWKHHGAGMPPHWLFIPSAGYAFGLAREQIATRGVAADFWLSIEVMHVASWILLLLASLIVRNAWQDKADSASSLRWRQKWMLWAYGNAVERSRFRQRLLDLNAYLWLAGRNRLKSAYVWLLLGTMLAIWLWLRFKYPNSMNDIPVYIFIGILSHSLLKLWLTSEACRTLFADRQSGTLELILSTPISVDEILHGQWLALQRQFAWPALTVLAADVVMFVAGNRSNSFAEGGQEWLLLFLAGTLMFVADLLTLGWVSMWLAMVTRRVNRATGGAVFRVLVLPWLLFVGCMTALALLDIEGFTPSLTFFIILWFAIGIATNAFFFTLARTNLRHRFRSLATERFMAKGSAWRTFFAKGDPDASTVLAEPVKLERMAGTTK